jgi:hypothetical protein
MFFDYYLSLLPEGNSKNKFSFFKRKFQNCITMDLKDYTNIFSILNPCNLFLFGNKYDIIFYMYTNIISVKGLENMIHIYFYLVY